MKHIDFVFDGPPGPEGPRFVEVENEEGKSIRVGRWLERDDGFWVIRIPYFQEEADDSVEEDG